MVTEIIALSISCATTLFGIISTIVFNKKASKQSIAFSILSNVPLYINEAVKTFGRNNPASIIAWTVNKIQLDLAKNQIALSEEELKEHIKSVMATPEIEEKQATLTDEFIKEQ